MTEISSFVRYETLDAQGLTAMEAHGRGLGAKCVERRRPDAEFRCVVGGMVEGKMQYLRVRPGSSSGLLALGDLLSAHRRRHSASVRKGAPLAAHFIVGVSPGWVDATGDRHDSANVRNRELMLEAVRFVQAEFGGVFAARMDLDEKGAAVVDVFAAPIRKSRNKPVVSTNKALEELGKRHGVPSKTFAGLQTAWHKWAVARLDPDIMRGKPKEVTQRENLSPEEFGRLMDDPAAVEQTLVERWKGARATAGKLAERNRDLYEENRALRRENGELRERLGMAAEKANGEIHHDSRTPGMR